MRSKALALAGSTGLLLCSTLFGAPLASAAPALAAAPAAPAAAAGQGLDFTAMLAPIAENKVAGSGELWVTLTGNRAKFTLQVGGLLAGAPHAAVIYADGAGKCPAGSKSSGNGGQSYVSPADAAASIGVAGTALTTAGDTSAKSALALTRFPTAGAYTYTRTFDVDPTVAAAIKNGTATMVVHGIDYNRNGKYDSVLGTTAGMPAEASAPALCGTFVASQMKSVPAGSANTGGGSTAPMSPSVPTGLGTVALLAAGGAALLAFRRRSAGPSAEEAVTNGLRRN